MFLLQFAIWFRLLFSLTPSSVAYRSSAKDGSSIYDDYYGGFKTMMPWLKGRE